MWAANIAITQKNDFIGILMSIWPSDRSKYMVKNKIIEHLNKK